MDDSAIEDSVLEVEDCDRIPKVLSVLRALEDR